MKEYCWCGHTLQGHGIDGTGKAFCNGQGAIYVPEAGCQCDRYAPLAVAQFEATRELLAHTIDAKKLLTMALVAMGVITPADPAPEKAEKPPLIHRVQ